MRNPLVYYLYYVALGLLGALAIGFVILLIVGLVLAAPVR